MWGSFKKRRARRGPTNWEFTPELEFAVGLARSEARRRTTSFVCPEHLLLGVLAAEGSAGLAILDRLGVSHSRLEERLHRYLLLRDGRLEGDVYTLSRRSQLAFDRMYQEATRLGAERMGTEHLLLGIVAEGDSLAARLLIRYGADRESLRRAADRSRDVVPAAPPEGSGQEPVGAD